MSKIMDFEDILTCRGLMLLKRFGNGQPSYSQIELSQAIISLISDDAIKSKKLDLILSKDGLSREEIRRDSNYLRYIYRDEVL